MLKQAPSSATHVVQCKLDPVGEWGRSRHRPPRRQLIAGEGHRQHQATLPFDVQQDSLEPAKGSVLDSHSLTDLQERPRRSEEHTSELQSRLHLVCRLLLEKKNEPNVVVWCFA